MADCKIDMVGPTEIPLLADIYNVVFRPARDAGFFRRRFQGRYNVLTLIASSGGQPIGFFAGFELKPMVFYEWLYGVVPTHRRQGVASQLVDGVHAWAAEHAYETMRLECHNQHRPMLRLAVDRDYDIVGLRWDSDRGENLVILEKSIHTP